MIKETRLMVRLIGLWIVLLGSLWLLIGSSQGLVTSITKAVNGGYETYYGSYGGAYGGNAYCLQAPIYPTTQSGMGMGMGIPPLPTEDKVVLDKYNEDYKKYNSEVEAKCKEDLEKQKKSQENQEKSSWMGDIASYSILVLLQLLMAVVSFVAIRKSEEAQ